MPGPRKAGSSDAPAPAAAGGTLYDAAAAPALALADELADRTGWRDAPDLLREARARIDRFAEDLRRARLPEASVAPARLALGLVLDQAARSNPSLPLRDWSAGAHRLLFDGEAMSQARLRDFVARAEAAGPAFAEVARFMRGCLLRIEGARSRREPVGGDGWGGLLAGAALGFAALVVAWMLYAEWSFHRDTGRAFAAEALAIGLDRRGAIADLPRRLDRMAAAVEGVDRSLGGAPVRLFAGVLGFDASARVHDVQAEAIRRHLPPVLARAIDAALASEGDSLALYETVRAWDILSGAAEWNAGFLRGWIEGRVALFPDLQGLGPHVALLRPPFEAPAPPDAELLAQARLFATEAEEADRAWIELLHSPALAGLPPWRPDREVPDLPDVVRRRSGLPIETAIPGAFTRAGWDRASAGGAAEAVARARAEAARMFPRGHPTQPDTERRVLERLQAETLAAWRSFLADLRVRDFDRRSVAVRVSGLLARERSPLAVLLSRAWVEVGGTDRSRPHAAQLRIAAEFGPTIQYVESGGLEEISALFAALNAALGARGSSEELLTERLMGFQDRAASVAALRQAPPVVVQVVEDVLAQTAVPRAAQIANPLTQRWQTEVFDLCRRATEGRFPFEPQGADAEPADFAALLGPEGAIDRFFRSEAEPYIDMTASPWRWRPEGRFSGLSPESAEVFERAAALRSAFFGESGRLGATVTIAALAERGKAAVSLGGASAAVDAASEAAVLAWPGADPAAGVSVDFEAQAAGASTAVPGPWGFLRLLAGLRLRERDDGRRFLVDLRSEAGRLFLELSFPSAANPVAGLAVAEGFGCPAAL